MLAVVCLMAIAISTGLTVVTYLAEWLKSWLMQLHKTKMDRTVYGSPGSSASVDLIKEKKYDSD